MEINKHGVLLVKHFESLRLKTYYDGGRVLTIGYGHTGKHATVGNEITEEKAEFLLLQDLEVAEAVVNKYVRVSLNSNQFSALVDLAFNVGGGQFRTSTILRLINEEKFFEASQQFKRWRYDKGVEVAGLFRRTISRRNLFCSFQKYIVLKLPRDWRKKIDEL